VETARSTQRPKLLSSFKTLIFFLSLFLLLFLFYDQSLLSSFRASLDFQRKEILSKEMENVKSLLADHLREAVEDPYFLYAEGSRANLRITLFERNGVVIRDSTGKVKNGAPLDLAEKDSVNPAGFWREEPHYYSYRKDEREESVYFDIFSSSNNPSPVGIRLIKESDSEENRESETYLFFLKLFGGVSLLTLGLTFYRFARDSFRKETLLGEKDFQDANPVFHTFQGLIQELKLKEQELEKLKNLAEIRALRSETFQETILRSVSSGVITFDKNRVITSLNESAEKIFEISKKDSVGKPCVLVFGPESKILAMLDKTIDDNEPIARAEMEVMKGVHPEKIWIGVSSSLLTDDQGVFLGTTFVFTDITEIKVFQEQVELQKRLTVLGEMSAGIAHEFRNFMGTIFGYVCLLGKKVEKNPPDHQMIEAIIAELKAMDYLIQELLSFGKNTPVNKGKVFLEPFFSRLIPQISSLYKGVLPKIRCEISEPNLSIYADEILVRQAFMNLIQNAFEAMPDGGELTVKAKVNPLEKNAMVLIRIEDTGTGIGKEHLEKIFVPFFTRKAKGTGLGLAIVHKIILSHGGRIRVESEPGKGARFQIYLPSGEGTG
jgi:PAS domain S-box-containing protein